MPPALLALVYGDDRSRITLTVDELAEVLDKSRSATYAAVGRGELPARRVGRQIVVPIPLLQQWLGLDVRPLSDDGPHEATVIRLAIDEGAQ
ncbi:helix-turn-helix domain-containing protein [Actinospongicola halichondriae]|uniref:helix-turn-helix domain-containing protein n=1 Tax=Actinospongicola halichondriae TaxID=3236844 RepID=UPI003D4B2767